MIADWDFNSLKLESLARSVVNSRFTNIKYNNQLLLIDVETLF